MYNYPILYMTALVINVPPIFVATWITMTDLELKYMYNAHVPCMIYILTF